MRSRPMLLASTALLALLSMTACGATADKNNDQPTPAAVSRRRVFG